MENRPTFSIDFVVRKSMANKKYGHFYAKITIDGGRPREIAFNEKVKMSDWNSKQSCLSGKGIEMV